MLDRERCELWSLVSEESKTMCLDARLRIAGHGAMTGEVVSGAEVLRDCRGNQQKAANLLDVSCAGLIKKVKRLRITA